MKVQMDIHASVEGSDLRGIFRVWIYERRLYRAFTFRLHDYQQSSCQFEVSHNKQEFLALRVSDDPNDEIANSQAEQLSLGRKELMYQMTTLVVLAAQRFTTTQTQALKNKGLWAMYHTQLASDYESAELSEAIYLELFSLPDTATGVTKLQTFQ